MRSNLSRTCPESSKMVLWFEVHLLHSPSRNKLGNLADNPAQYQKLLEGLIAQALFQLCEKECVIKCREEDIDLVKKAIPSAQVIMSEKYSSRCVALSMTVFTLAWKSKRFVSLVRTRPVLTVWLIDFNDYITQGQVEGSYRYSLRRKDFRPISRPLRWRRRGYRLSRTSQVHCMLYDVHCSLIPHSHPCIRTHLNPPVPWISKVHTW